MGISHDQVTQALREVFDPELGMSIVDLGLVYDIDIEAGLVRVTMTMTTQTCPLHDAMAEWVRAAIERIPGVQAAMVQITFTPPWTPALIKHDAHRAGVLRQAGS
jgi:metal-sulfur cluster biosynthetic enzyme